MMKDNIKTYSELMKLKTFDERFEYLKLDGIVGNQTFGFDRYLNQMFYESPEWKRLRKYIIVRDNGNDLGSEDHPISGRIYIHHMNPITVEDIVNKTDFLLNPDYVICTSKLTHMAIHYSNSDLLPKSFVTRTKNDMCPWRH